MRPAAVAQSLGDDVLHGGWGAMERIAVDDGTKASSYACSACLSSSTRCGQRWARPVKGTTLDAAMT